MLVLEMVVSAGLRADTPADVVDTLRYMAREEDYPFETRLDDPLFTDPIATVDHSWRDLLFAMQGETSDRICGVFYARMRSSYPSWEEGVHGWELSFRVLVADYGLDVYAAFLALLIPYVRQEGFIGYYRWENEEDPLLLYFGDGKLYERHIDGSMREMAYHL